MNTKDSSNQIDMEQLLQDGNILKLKPQGYSMYPLFIPKRDEAVIEPVDVNTLRRNDVVLYRRDSGILVLHRILKTNPKEKEYGNITKIHHRQRKPKSSAIQKVLYRLRKI